MLTSGSLRPLIDVPAGGRFEAESGEITRRWPQFLPGGKTLLFMAHGNTGAAHQGHVIVQNASGRTLVQRGAVFGRYSPSGHLLYVNGGKLFAAPFDADHLQVTGRAVPIADDIATALISGTAQYAFSDTGMWLPSLSRIFSENSSLCRPVQISPEAFGSHRLGSPPRTGTTHVSHSFPAPAAV